MAQHNLFSGIWRSHYTYTSSSQAGELENEHFVQAFQRGNKLVLESVPGAKSYLVLRLSIDDNENVATGIWQESTEQDGRYKGAVYHGAIQLIINDDKKQLAGKWLGYGKEREVNVGPWQLSYVGSEVPAAA